MFLRSLTHPRIEKFQYCGWRNSQTHHLPLLGAEGFLNPLGVGDRYDPLPIAVFNHGWRLFNIKTHLRKISIRLKRFRHFVPFRVLTALWKKYERSKGVKYAPWKKFWKYFGWSKMVQKVFFTCIVWKLNSESFRPKNVTLGRTLPIWRGSYLTPPPLEQFVRAINSVQGARENLKKMCVKWFNRNCQEDLERYLQTFDHGLKNKLEVVTFDPRPEYG